MRAITFDGNIVSEAKDITDASTTSGNTITITIMLPGSNVLRADPVPL